MLFIDLAVSPPFKPREHFTGSTAVCFTNPPTTVCSFFLLPGHRGPGAGAKTRHHLCRARSFIAQRSRLGHEWEECAVSPHKCSIYGLLRTLAAMRSPGCLLTGAVGKHCLFCSCLVTKVSGRGEGMGDAGYLCQLPPARC